MNAVARVSVEELKGREHLTCGQCARVWGRGPEFFRGLYQAGMVTGYTAVHTLDGLPSGKPRLYLNTETVRGYFRALEIAEAQKRARLDAFAPKRPVSMRELLDANPAIQKLRQEVHPQITQIRTD